jgi:hypothetical protein
MDQSTMLGVMIGAAVIGIVATLLIVRRDRRATEQAARGEEESPFAVATEGMKRCPNCGFGNLVTDADCASCGKPLPG